ncbi:MAG: anthranilate synthase component I family protein [Polyangiaceae bacterium]|nr:anthranilate synthase component I family protein [Polyangiaceae bacterium]
MLEKGATNPDASAIPTTIRALRVLAPPDPLRLLTCLSAQPGRFGLLSPLPPPEGTCWRSFVGAFPLEFSRDLAPPPAPRARGLWASVPRWVGLLPYEAVRCTLERPGWTPQEHRPLPHHLHPYWARYGAVLVVDHPTGEVFVVGDQQEACWELKRLAEHPPPTEPPFRARSLPSEPLERHRERVAAALEFIRAGDIYQVNLARRLDIEIQGGLGGLLAKLMATFPSPFVTLLELPGVAHVCSTSPELFLATQGQTVETHPIKGTRKRGRNAQEDEEQRRALDADPKERAELAMVLDLERNDLGKLAIPGTVRVRGAPRVVTYRTLHHRVAEVTARMPPGVTPHALIEAMLPSGSVTGAPKVRAMEVIAELEASRRGLYTGALGYMGHDGELRLAMAIRTLTVQGEEGHYHSGSGIVADSDPEREVEETQVKALQLAAVLNHPRR